MVSACLPSDALLQHLPSHLGFSYLGRGVSLHGCSSKAQPIILTLGEGYLLTAALPDLQCGIAPLGPPVPGQPQHGVGPPSHCPLPRAWGAWSSSSLPPPLASGLGAWGSSYRPPPLTSDVGYCMLYYHSALSLANTLLSLPTNISVATTGLQTFLKDVIPTAIKVPGDNN